LLGRPLEVSLTKESGLAGLIFLIKQHLGLELSKDDHRLLALNEYVTEEFDAGRQTGIEWEELRPVVDRVFADVELRQAAV
jgi:2-phosphinomethylmalic acid synthase